MSFGGLYYPGYTPGLGSKPRFQTMHPFRHLVGAGSNMNNKWAGSSGHSDYGLEAPDYDYHSGPPAHMPSGGSYSYHATAGTGYGPPALPGAHPPAKPTENRPDSGKKSIFGRGDSKRGSSAMSALTLLSFLFFINLLQSCVKDHMDAMNPTVMVMTTNVIRNRFNKMGEMNSREQQSSSYTSNAANIVVQPADLVQAAAAHSPSLMDATRPSVNLQTTYSHNPVSYNTPIEQTISQPPSQYNMHNTPEPEVPINYAKPQYDPYTRDPYDRLPQAHHTLSYDNHTLNAQAPPHKLPPLEQHYNFHHTEYNAQPPPQPSIVVPQYTSSQNPFYEHEHTIGAKPYNNDYGSQYVGSHQDYDIRQKYEMTQQQQNSKFSQSSPFNNDHHPWSSNLPTSSVVSGPFRRASIYAVSPKTRWITVPAKIIDRTHFEQHNEEIEEQIEHHDDRDVFRSRFN